MAAELSLVAGGGSRTAENRPPAEGLGQPFDLPAPPQPTFCEIFPATARDGGWAGFLLPQLSAGKPVLWVQERMAIRECGRIYPSGLPGLDLVHVEARNARDALWAMEEGLRCPALGAVIGEIGGDPASLDFTATRRLAVAAEHSGVACWLARLGGHANLSGARMRWRIASLRSLPHAFDPKAPGSPAWDTELFRARSHAPGRWSLVHEADRFRRFAFPGDRTVGQSCQRAA